MLDTAQLLGLRPDPWWFRGLPHPDVAVEVDIPAQGKSPCLEGMTPVQNGREASQHEVYGR